MHSPPSQARSNKLVLKTKLLVRRHFRGHAHERSRMWIDHLFCNEQSSNTRSDKFGLGDGFLCKQTLVVQEASWAVLRLPKFFIPNGKMNTKLRFWSLTVKSSWSE